VRLKRSANRMTGEQILRAWNDSFPTSKIPDNFDALNQYFLEKLVPLAERLGVAMDNPDDRRPGDRIVEGLFGRDLQRQRARAMFYTVRTEFATWPLVKKSIRKSDRKRSPELNNLAEMEHSQILIPLMLRLEGYLHAIADAGADLSKSGVRKKRNRVEINKERLRKDAEALRKERPGISRRAAALVLAETFGLGERQIQRMFNGCYTTEEWKVSR